MFLITVKKCEWTYIISGNYNVQKNQGSVNEQVLLRMVYKSAETRRVGSD